MKSVPLQEVFVEGIRDLFDAEKQLVKALPKMARSADDSELEDALREHLEQTKGQVQRLEQVFELLDTAARGKSCKGMKGLVEEGEEHVSEHEQEGCGDPVIIGAARRVEHYEMAAYEVASEMAQELGMREAAQLLQQTLREEIAADRKLSQIGKRLLREASRDSAEQEGADETERGGRTRSARSGSGRSSQGRSQQRRAPQRTSSAQAGGRSEARGNNSRSGSSAGTRLTTDHDEIREWAEERGARPACVKGTGGRGDFGMIRLDFPGYSGEESLQEIPWEAWFQKFDENDLALLYQEKTARGQRSNFNKLVKRDTAGVKGSQAKPKVRTAR